MLFNKPIYKAMGNIMYNSIYNYIYTPSIIFIINNFINPFFYYYDILNEKKEKEKKEQKEKTEKKQEYTNYYDIKNDLLIINYKNINNKEYILKINRNIQININELIEKLKKEKHEEDVLLNVTYKKQDFTEKCLKYLGPNGIHNKYRKVLVKDIIDENEEFDKIEIMDDMCEIKILSNINDNFI